MSYRNSLPSNVVQDLDDLRLKSDWVEDVLRQLDRVLESDCFERVQATSRAFLAHVVAQKSDTPREAGGLMSWAASKAVGPLV